MLRRRAGQGCLKPPLRVDDSLLSSAALLRAGWRWSDDWPSHNLEKNVAIRAANIELGGSLLPFNGGGDTLGPLSTQEGIARFIIDDWYSEVVRYLITASVEDEWDKHAL